MEWFSIDRNIQSLAFVCTPADLDLSKWYTANGCTILAHKQRLIKSVLFFTSKTSFSPSSGNKYTHYLIGSEPKQYKYLLTAKQSKFLDLVVSDTNIRALGQNVADN